MSDGETVCATCGISVDVRGNPDNWDSEVDECDECKIDWLESQVKKLTADRDELLRLVDAFGDSPVRRVYVPDEDAMMDCRDYNRKRKANQ